MLPVWGQRGSEFIGKQIWLIRQGGLRTLAGYIIMVILLPVWIVVLLAVRALKPFVLIRFGKIVALRLGHFALEPELYLCERDAGMYGPRTIDISYYSPPVSNMQLKKMWDRMLTVSQIAFPLYQVNLWLPGARNHMVPFPPGHMDPYGFLERTSPHLSFTPAEETLGRRELIKLGVLPDHEFVCFHARDSRYLQEAHKYRSDWSYHDYRDSSISNYLPAAEELANRGYYAIRMGMIVKEALQTTSSQVIDYATKARSDFMDIYLAAKCRFMIVSNTGPCALGWIFRKRIAFVNVIPLESRIDRSGDLFIPKKYWFIKEQRFMTFKEIIASRADGFYHSPDFAKNGIEVIENTAEEITALAIEMDERLNGAWKTTEGDEELQRQFWAIIESSGKLQGICRGAMRIGTDFLRRNESLLS